ncbi:MAG: DUF928 domain-containing protein [bacterium]|nr:DUF928 domain-containing protein [bacterium]
MTGNERWGLLFADLYASDERDLEILVRYAEDPEALCLEDRRKVEARLAADPSWHDRLRVLQRFDAAVVDDEGNEEEGRLAEVIPLPRRVGPGVAAWVAVAAAAALALWFGVGFEDASNPARKPALIVHDEPSRPPAHEIIAPPAPPATSVESVDEVELAIEAVKTPVRREIESPRHERVAAEQPRAETTPPAREVPTLEAVPVPEPIVLAMLEPVHYAAPADRALRGMPGGLLRGEGARVLLEAWVPDHVARSASAQPVLFWAMAGELPATHRLGFALTSETDPEPLYEGELASPQTPGRQSIDLSALTVALSEGTIYRWTVFVRAPSSDPSEDRIAQGWVQYQAAPDSLARQTQSGSLAERAAVYAESGYWYDALQLLVALEDAHPGRTKPREVLASFLAEAGIE